AAGRNRTLFRNAFSRPNPNLPSFFSLHSSSRLEHIPFLRKGFKSRTSKNHILFSLRQSLLETQKLRKRFNFCPKLVHRQLRILLQKVFRFARSPRDRKRVVQGNVV